MVILEGDLGYLGVKKYIHQYSDTPPFKSVGLPWPGSSTGWSVILMRQGCVFHPWSGHMQESTNECINKWNSRSMSLSLSPFFSFSKKK